MSGAAWLERRIREVVQHGKGTAEPQRRRQARQYADNRTLLAENRALNEQVLLLQREMHRLRKP